MKTRTILFRIIQSVSKIEDESIAPLFIGLQDGLLNSRIALRVSKLNCQKNVFQTGTHTFFRNSNT
jgi:hypothetical protein